MEASGFEDTSSSSTLTMKEDSAAEASLSRRDTVCSYLSWNEETRLDGSSYQVVITYDPEIISHLDLGDPSLFLFPGLGPSRRSSSWHTTDDTLSTKTSCSDDVDKLNVRAPLLAGTRDRWPTYWTSENADEDKSAPRVCSFQGLIDDCQSKWLQQSPGTLSSVGTPENSHDTNWKCEVCGRRCRDAKALQYGLPRFSCYNHLYKDRAC